MDKKDEKILAIIIVLIILLIFCIVFIQLDQSIIEGNMSHTYYTDNYDIIQEYQNFNLIDSVVDFFTPKIFRSSSYEKKYSNSNSNSTSNSNSNSNMAIENPAMKIRRDTLISNPDQDYPVCEEKNYTPKNAIRPDWNYRTVYSMCGDVPIGKWGVGSEGVNKSIANCNYDANYSKKDKPYRWGSCNENLSSLENNINYANRDSEYPICQEKSYTPETAINREWNDRSVYAMCGDIPIAKWGLGKNNNVRESITNCDYDARNSERKPPYRWGKCADIVKDTPICSYFNYSNNTNLRDDWSSGGYYATCNGMPIGKADRQNNLIEEKNKCMKQAAQGRWGKCSDSKYSKRPTCNVDNNGKIAITCTSNHDEGQMKIGNWLNNNIIDCAKYAITLPNCKDLF